MSEQDDPPISRTAGLQANRDGAAAAKAGAEVSTCPYPASPVGQAFRRHHWLKGYRLAHDAGLTD